MPNSDLRDIREGFSEEVALMYYFSKGSNFSDNGRVRSVGKESLLGRGSNRSRDFAM